MVHCLHVHEATDVGPCPRRKVDECAHPARAAATWCALLSEDSQPSDDRDTYRLLADFVRALAAPPDTRILQECRTWSCSEGLRPHRAGDAPPNPLSRLARLGYLVFVARALASAEVDPGWIEIERLGARAAASLSSGIVLFACDRSSNPHDGVAAQWRLRRGVDMVRLRQIVEQGDC